MDTVQFVNLQIGDIIQGEKGEGWVITGKYPTTAQLNFVATRTILVTNPTEWKLVCKKCGRIK